MGIGLRFEFGDNAAEVVGSVRHTYTDTNNTVTGFLGEVAVPVITEHNHGPKIRAMGLVGSTCVQGTAGVGYDFANNQALIGAGVQGPYVEGGVNFLFNSELHPYVGVNSFGCAPGATTTFLPAPDTEPVPRVIIYAICARRFEWPGSMQPFRFSPEYLVGFRSLS